MPISDSGIGGLHRSPAYRAALWVVRLTYAWALVLLLAIFVVRARVPVLFVLVVCGGVLLVGTPPLLRRAGIPTTREVRRDPGARARQTRFYRDVLWLYRW